MLGWFSDMVGILPIPPELVATPGVYGTPSHPKRVAVCLLVVLPPVSLQLPHPRNLSVPSVPYFLEVPATTL